MADIKYEIEKEFAIISEVSKGWKKAFRVYFNR